MGRVSVNNLEMVKSSVGKQGMVYVFTGEGKGKTSAALWTAVRAAKTGMRVVVIMWYKEARWPTVDQEIGENFENMEIFLMGRGFYQLPTDHASVSDHKEAAKMALELAREKLRKVDLLVLDEVVNAIGDGLVSEDEVVKLIESRGKTHLILTGRGVSKKLIWLADLVTEMKKIKHPFDRGIKAVRGLDY